MANMLLTRFNVVFTCIVAAFGLVIAALARTYDTGVTVSGVLYMMPLRVSVQAFILAYVSGRVFYIMIVQRPRRLTRAILADFRKELLNRERILTALPVLVLMTVFFSLFTSAKSLIPVIYPFSLDPALAEIDRILHFGRHPWQWLHPVIGVAIVSSTLSFFYKTWFFSKFMVCMWQAFSLKRPRLREQFFLTFLASWIVNGFILAVLLSSAGPCYFGNLYPGIENPYEPLMAYLRGANETYPIHEFFAMDYLWNAYSERKTAIFSGISAMPSMHVAVAFMQVLLGWRINRFAGWFFTVYLFIIMVGSVHLGWHYAIDGYLSIAVTWVLWVLIGQWTGRDEMPVVSGAQTEDKA